MYKAIYYKALEKLVELSEYISRITIWIGLITISVFLWYFVFTLIIK